VKQFWALMLVVLATTLCGLSQTTNRVAPNGSGPQSSQFLSSATLKYQGQLPDAPSQKALTDEEKFEIFREDAVSPLTFVSAGVTAGYNTSYNRNYGRGWTAFGKNYAVAVAQHETSSFFGNYVFPKLLNQDPRYHYSGKTGFFPRATYAATRVFITRNDSGEKTVNSSYLLGALVSTAITNCYRAPRTVILAKLWRTSVQPSGVTQV